VAAAARPPRRRTGGPITVGPLTNAPPSSGTSDTPGAGAMGRRRFLHVLGLGAGTLAVTGATGLTWKAVDGGVFATGTGAAYAAWDGAALGLLLGWPHPPFLKGARGRLGTSRSSSASTVRTARCRPCAGPQPRRIGGGCASAW
jgi:hypothetical protein